MDPRNITGISVQMAEICRAKHGPASQQSDCAKSYDAASLAICGGGALLRTAPNFDHFVDMSDVCGYLKIDWNNCIDRRDIASQTCSQRRDLAVLNFSESLTVAGDVSFQPRGLQFGSFVEPFTVYEVAKNFGDRFINGRVMARQTSPKIAKIQNCRHVGHLCRTISTKRARNSKIAVERLLEEVQLC